MRVTEEFMALLREMLTRMADAGHRTVWHGHDGSDHLVYFTFAPDTARRARAALRGADCLCATTLGRTETMVAIKDEPEPAKEASADEETDNWSGTWCAQCGFNVKVDEDGCCLSCGCQAVGQGVEEAIALRNQVENAKQALVDAVKQLGQLRGLVQVSCDGSSEDDPAVLVAMRMEELVALRARLNKEG